MRALGTLLLLVALGGCAVGLVYWGLQPRAEVPTVDPAADPTVKVADVPELPYGTLMPLFPDGGDPLSPCERVFYPRLYAMYTTEGWSIRFVDTPAPQLLFNEDVNGPSIEALRDFLATVPCWQEYKAAYDLKAATVAGSSAPVEGN